MERQYAHPYAGIAANTYVKTVDDFAPQSFDDCASFANTHEVNRIQSDPNEWKIASNMRLRFHPGGSPYDVDDKGEIPHCFAIVLYDTEIVRYFMDDKFSVDNGGFTTPTSSRRISQFTPDGYNFYHHNKKLVMNFGTEECTHERRFPNVMRLHA